MGPNNPKRSLCMKAKNPHAVALGRIGGKTTGTVKRRSHEHYKRISLLGVLARQNKELRK